MPMKECKYCKTDFLFGIFDMEGIDDEESEQEYMFYNFCPMCGRKLKKPEIKLDTKAKSIRIPKDVEIAHVEYTDAECGREK